MKEYREKYENVLLLDAGDQSQGTPWYTEYKGRAAAHFMSMLGYDAMAFGNHEFDFGVSSFVNNFAENITDESGHTQFPILGCNIDSSNENAFHEVYQNSTIVTKNGVKIGIVGYITPDTKFVSDTGLLEFNDVLDSVQKEADRLRSHGCEFIIGLGHIGLEHDKELARQSDLDLIIGGHSHSLLSYNSTLDPDDIDRVLGPYPVFETNTKGRAVPILTAYWSGKYLGAVHIQLQSDGDKYVLTDDIQGQPILLDNSVPNDIVIQAEIEKWATPLRTFLSKPIGYSTERLEIHNCRQQECKIGDLVTDLISYYYKNVSV